MKKIILLIFTAFFLSLSPGLSLGAESISIKSGELTAVVDGQSLVLPTPPVIKDGHTLVPLRFITEILGAGVYWEPAAQKINLSYGDINTTLVIGNKQAIVNGQVQQLAICPELKHYSITMVPLRFLIETFGWDIQYVSDNKEIIIKKNKPPAHNLPPIASFSLSKTTVDMGETIYYTDESFDPDGTIIETYWKGNKRAYFQPGDYTISLQVRDNLGLLSNTYSQNIHVTEKTMLDELSYHITYPNPGEILSNTQIQSQNLPELQTKTENGQRTLLVSNNPESVTEAGILYHDKVNGPVRLFYHHRNGNDNPLMFYVIAVNTSNEPATVLLEKGGSAGPRTETLEVGKSAMVRYLSSNIQSELTVKPNDMLLINDGQKAKTQEVVSGIYDLSVDSEIEIYFIAVESVITNISVINELPVLERENKHIRGTFEDADRFLMVDAKDSGRLPLVNGNNDSAISGYDTTTGEVVINPGNYGVMYQIKIDHTKNTAFFFESRGGFFSGALKIDDHTVSLPKWGMIKPAVDLVMLKVQENFTNTSLEFMPPGGSSLPVQLVIWMF